MIGLSKSGVFHRLGIFLLSLAYGAFLASLPLDVFKDRVNYLNYADQSSLIFLRYWSESYVTVLTNEPLWLLLNTALRIFFDAETTLRFIIGVPASIVAFQVLRSNPKNFFWLLIFLLLPQVVKNHVIHLRQGVALSIFLIGWFSGSKSLRLILFCMTPFVHASFFFIMSILVFSEFFRALRFSIGLRSVLFVTYGILVSSVVFRVSEILNARQVSHYEFDAVDISGVGFIFWLIVWCLFFLQGRKFMRLNSFAIAVLLFYLSSYFFIQISGRIFESGMIVILLAGIQLSSWRRQAFLALITSYGFFSYLLRLGQPWLGFGTI